MSDGKVNLEENSKYRVAFDLMHRITGYEKDIPSGTEREYFLRLYHQCFEAVNRSRSIDEIVAAQPRKLVVNEFGGAQYVG